VIDPRTPVVVGVGQLSRRPDDLTEASEPADMMAEVLRRAQEDSKADVDLLRRATSADGSV
jgi:acetyl-CoA C-acetyltransferase